MLKWSHLRRKKLSDFNTFVTTLCYGKQEWPTQRYHGLICPVRNPLKRRTLQRRSSPAAPLLNVSGGEIPDVIFKGAMTACGLAVLAVLVLIVYELVIRSGLSWHAFGFRFFGTSDWDPVSEQFGALAIHLWDAGFLFLGV